MEDRTPGSTGRSVRSDSHRSVAHYPTGASKWNLIEHRLFSEISKNWAGEPLDSYQKTLNFIRFTKTHTGLSVSAHLDRRHCPTGTEPTPQQFHALRLKPHDVLPKWNFTISPKGKYPRLEGKTATFSLRACPPSVEATDESAIPAEYRILQLKLPAVTWERLLDGLEIEQRSASR